MSDEKQFSSDSKPGGKGRPDPQVGGAMGSPQPEPSASQPEGGSKSAIEAGPSGSSPQHKPPAGSIGGQVGGVAGTAPPRDTQPGSALPGGSGTPQPARPKRRDGCFGAVLMALPVVTVLGLVVVHLLQPPVSVAAKDAPSWFVPLH